MAPLDRAVYRATLEREIAAFVGALHGDPERPVASCPGWDIRELCWHLGEVQASWAQPARTRRAARGANPAGPMR